MPEYLSPGVYVEETSFRAKSIEGVATSTAGFVGQCRYGPVNGAPQLVTSFEEFQRYFGTMNDLLIGGQPRTNFMAHAVSLFFRNGGKRVYIARIFEPTLGTVAGDHRAHGPELLNDPNYAARFRARYPGRAGNLTVTAEGLRSGNLLVGEVHERRLNGVRPGDVVEAVVGDPKDRLVREGSAETALDPAQVYFVSLNDEGVPVLDNAVENLNYQETAELKIQKVTLSIRVLTPPNGREDSYQGLSTHPESTNFIGTVLRHENPDDGIEPPADRTARIYLETENVPADATGQRAFARDLLLGLVTQPAEERVLANGGDGLMCTATQYRGGGTGDAATGLAALAEIEDIAIVATPDGAAYHDPAGTAQENSQVRQAIRNALVTHCELLRYRFAILSATSNADGANVREIRGMHDSTYAALYFPWIVVPNPFNAIGQGRNTLLIPPDGAVAGIYARSDIERGVHKAPANEIVRGALRFSRNVNKGVQDTLNPEGINCLRFFEGRGYRVWGARTISSDPEWTYLSVRRLFIYLEHSIDRGTQWAVFEPNNEELWLKIRLTIESFLYDTWRTCTLMGRSPDEAYFVRCDRTTMSQGDLDNGRLVCLIGVAPTKPAEFVIFRIGQWTADASIV